MKFFACGLAVLSLTGCVLDNDNDVDIDLQPGDMNVEWRLFAGFPDGSETECVAGDRIVVLVHATSGGPVDPYCFDCRDRNALLPPLNPDLYDVTVQLTDQPACVADSSPLAQSDTIPAVDLRDRGKTVLAEFDVDGGFFNLEWSIAGGSLVSGCATANADRVQVLPTAVGDPTPIDPIRFPCEDGAGELKKLRSMTTFSLVFDLIDGDGDIIPGFTVDRLNQNIDFGNHQPAVQPVVFPAP